MNQSIQAIVHDRHITVAVPDEIPDGAQVEVRLVSVASEVGMNESQWRTDAESIRKWCEEVDSFEPVEFRSADDFDKKFAEFNVQAVREQMFGDDK